VHARRNNLVIPQSQQPFDLLADELPGRVVGIFATNAAGRMTHPGSSVHAHLIFEVESEKSATGHLEQFGIKAGSTLKIPKGNTH